MAPEELKLAYRGYITCLNSHDWKSLGLFVAEDVEYNGSIIGLEGYRRMLEGDFKAIPDLRFNIDLLISEPPTIACRLLFHCTPTGQLFDIPVNGRRVQFSENVFYVYASDLITKVWSVIDTAAIRQKIESI